MRGDVELFFINYRENNEWWVEGISSDGTFEPNLWYMRVGTRKPKDEQEKKAVLKCFELWMNPEQFKLGLRLSYPKHGRCLNKV
jgi:hypothetical protein